MSITRQYNRVLFNMEVRAYRHYLKRINEAIDPNACPYCLKVDCVCFQEEEA